MEEELQKTANEALKGIIEGVASAKEFILAELPEVVQQLLMWKMAESIIVNILSIATALSIAIIPFKIFRWWRKNVKEHGRAFPVESWVYKRDAEPGVVGTFIVTTIIPVVIILAHTNITWLQIWIAPKVYLLEYAASLVK